MYINVIIVPKTTIIISTLSFHTRTTLNEHTLCILEGTLYLVSTKSLVMNS